MNKPSKIILEITADGFAGKIVDEKGKFISEIKSHKPKNCNDCGFSISQDIGQFFLMDVLQEVLEKCGNLAFELNHLPKEDYSDNSLIEGHCF
jgi:hypothetical protein